MTRPCLCLMVAIVLFRANGVEAQTDTPTSTPTNTPTPTPTYTATQVSTPTPTDTSIPDTPTPTPTAVATIPGVAFDGKRKSFHSITTTSAAIGSFPGTGAVPFLSGTITIGKPNRVLTAEATMTTGQASLDPWTLAMGADMNGLPMNPGATFPNSVVQDCASSGLSNLGCTASASFMIDIDVAEAANPGCCIGVPLVVTLHGATSQQSLPNRPIDATLAIRVERKN